MTDKAPKAERLTSLNSEFRRLIEFHAISFKEIDDKARYWLTAALPAFLALSGFLFQKGGSLAEPLLCAAYALAVCLLASVYFFAFTLLSLRVESGVLAPQSRSMDNAVDVLESDEKWEGLTLSQTNELLRAIKINEAQNARKSSRLRKAEISLFLSAPTAVCLAAGTALVYSAAGPLFGAPASVPPGAPTIISLGNATAVVGAAIGGLSTAAFFALSHFLTSRRTAEAE